MLLPCSGCCLCSLALPATRACNVCADAATLSDDINKHRKALFYMPLHSIGQKDVKATLLEVPAFRFLSLATSVQPDAKAKDAHAHRAYNECLRLLSALVDSVKMRSYDPPDVVVGTSLITGAVDSALAAPSKPDDAAASKEQRNTTSGRRRSVTDSVMTAAVDIAHKAVHLVEEGRVIPRCCAGFP